MNRTGDNFTGKTFLTLLFFFLVIMVPERILASGGLEEGMETMARQIVANSKAKNKRSIGIAAFPHINGDYSELSNFIADELVLQLFTIPDSDLEIIERNQLNKIFKELNLSTTGVVDAASIQQLGRLHGVDALVLGSITDIGEQIKVTARLVDTETGRVFSAAGTTIPETGNVRELMGKILVEAEHRTSSGGSRGTIGTSRGSGQKKKKHETALFTLDLMQYEIGDVPEELGSVVVTDGKKIKNRRVVKRFQEGMISIDNLRLTGDFTIEFVAYRIEYEGANKVKLYFSDDQVIQWRFTHGNQWMYFGDDRTRIQIPLSKTPRKYKIKAKGRVVKFYIDDTFLGSQTRELNSMLNRFTCTLKSNVNEFADLIITQN